MSDYIVTIGADNKITIPADVLDSLGWASGTQLGLLPQTDGTLLIEEIEPSADPVSEGHRKRRR